MVDSFKELKERIDANQNKLLEKLELGLAEARGKLDKNADEIAHAKQEAISSLAQTDSKLSATIAQSERKIATIAATIRTATLIFSLATIATAVLSSVGIWQIVKTQLEVKSEREQFEVMQKRADSIIKEQGLINQDALIEKLESELSSQQALDGLRTQPDAVAKIRAYAERLKRNNESLAPEQRSDYHRMAEALGYYLQENCDAALGTLEQIKQSDQGQFSYAYMRGVCLLRQKKLEQAHNWFKIASRLTQGQRQLMTQNAQAVALLYQWKTSKTAHALDDAITILSSLVKTNPTFAPAYIDLAGAMAQKEEYSETSKHLKTLRSLESFTAEKIVDAIHEDVSRPHEDLFSGYVKHHLNITLSPLDPNWRRLLRTALPM